MTKRRPLNPSPRKSTGAQSTRPGTLVPESLELLPAVAAALREARHRLPGTSIAGCCIAADILEDMAAGRDPRARFDAGKGARVRDWTARLVLAKLQAGASIAEAVRTVAGETGRDVKTVRRHLQAFARESWPGPVVWRRADGTTDADSP